MVHPIVPLPPDPVKIDWSKPIKAKGGMPVRYVTSLRNTDQHVIAYTGSGPYEWVEVVNNYGKIYGSKYSHDFYEIENAPEEEWVGIMKGAGNWPQVQGYYLTHETRPTREKFLQYLRDRHGTEFPTNLIAIVRVK